MFRTASGPESPQTFSLSPGRITGATLVVGLQSNTPKQRKSDGLQRLMDNMGSKKPGVYDLRQLTWRDMLGPLFRKRQAVLVTFCLIFGVALFAAWGWANHYYVATMQVVVARERTDPTVTGQQNAVAGNDTMVTADEVASEVALLQGRDMLKQVAQTCGLTKENPSVLDSFKKFESQDPTVEKAKVLERATKGLAASLRVEPQKSSHVIDVQYGRVGAPETPACVLQTLGNLYLEKHLRLQRPAGTYDFFATETEKYQRALANSESRLENFSKSEGISAPDILRTDLAQQLVAAQAALYQARQAIAADQQRIQNLQKQMGGTPARSSTVQASLSANILLEQLQASLLTSQVKQADLQMKYDPSHPLVQEVDKEIALTKDAIAKAEAEKYVNTTTDRDPTFEYLRQDQARTEADLASQQATATASLDTIQAMRSEMVNLDLKALKQAALVRDAKVNEENYLLYVTKREQERTSDALDEKRIANVAIAVPAETPVLPAHNPFPIMFAGFFIAALGAIVLGYLMDFMDPSFRTPEELENALKVTVLAAVPRQVA
jgi:uncharacterized protein involved in exopolysaccharide biosynthesis